jgi:hypothetical protein
MKDLKGRVREAEAAERPVYYVSDRPEAYEIWGEISHDGAARIGRLIAERAGRHFPSIEFRVDGAWHLHQPGTERVAAFIEEHLQTCVTEALAE